jgi:hypothetical protein
MGTSKPGNLMSVSLVMSWGLVKYKSNYNIILSYLLLFSLLIVCGDIELNPGAKRYMYKLKIMAMLRTIVVFLSKRFFYKNIYLLDINISCVIFYLSYFKMFRFCIYVLAKDLLHNIFSQPYLLNLVKTFSFDNG